METTTVPTERDEIRRKPHSWEAPEAAHPKLYRPGHDASQVQHVFHSGWTASSDGALDNANQLRNEMDARGVHTSPSQWSVYSDPQEWKVGRDKDPTLDPLNADERVPTAAAAARQMMSNTLDHVPTMWHGHSQGGAQITAATELATKMLASDDGRRRKAGREADEFWRKTHPGKDGRADPAQLKRLHELMAKQDVDEHGNTWRIEKQPIVSSFGTVDEDEKVVWDVPVSEAEQRKRLGDQIAREKAEKKINKYNMFSYSGAASYPQEYVGSANFAHNGWDPVSSAAVSATSGPSWKEGDGRVSQTIKEGAAKTSWIPVAHHGYGANYAENDARASLRLLDQGGFQRGADAPGDAHTPLGPTVNGLRVNDGGGVINTGGSAYAGTKNMLGSAYTGTKNLLGRAYTATANAMASMPDMLDELGPI